MRYHINYPVLCAKDVASDYILMEGREHVKG